MVVSSLFWLALVAIAVWALVRLVGHQTRTGARSHQDEMSSGLSAEEILRQRYARGEIDEATFKHMQEQLARSSSRETVPPDADR
jgi:uncharacterized membrane protein